MSAFSAARSSETVLWPVPPQPVESLLSWSVRTATENILPGCYALLRRAGQDYLGRPSYAWSGPIDTALLAATLGASEEEVLRRRCPAAEPAGFVWLNGVRVRADDMVTNARRFAPASLASEPVHLSSWMVRAVPYCPVNWQYLKDSCSECGAVQRWRKAVDMRLCDRCGEDLSAQPTVEVAQDIREPLKAVAALIGVDDVARHHALAQLSGPLRSLDGGEALELAQVLARLLSPDLPAAPPIRTSNAQVGPYCKALARAWTMMQDFPASVTAVLKQELYDNEAAASRLHSSFKAAAGSARLTTLPAVTTAMGHVLSMLSENGKTPARHIRVKPAAWLLGATETEIAAGRDTGVFRSTMSFSSGRLLKTLDRAEITMLSAVRLSRLGQDHAARLLGLPGYAVWQLAAENLLRVERHPWLQTRYGDFITTSAAVEELQARLAARSLSEAPFEGVQISRVMRGYGGGTKPWSAIIRRMLSGDLPFFLDTRGEIGRVMIPPDARAPLLGLPFGLTPTSFTQRDAVEVLNLKLLHCHALAAHARTDLNGHSWSIEAGKLQALAQRYVTTGELMARHDHHARGIRDTLIAAGVAPPATLGWSRESVGILSELLRHKT